MKIVLASSSFPFFAKILGVLSLQLKETVNSNPPLNTSPDP